MYGHIVTNWGYREDTFCRQNIFILSSISRIYSQMFMFWIKLEYLLVFCTPSTRKHGVDVRQRTKTMEDQHNYAAQLL